MMDKRYTYLFSFFRVIFGVYLFFHLIDLIAYSEEIWGATGTIADPGLNLTHGLFPNVLYLIDNQLGLRVFLIVLVVLSFSLIIGFKRNWAAIIIWYGWVCLFDRNNLIANPALPFIGWLLLVLSVVSKGEPFSVDTSKDGWAMPKWLYVGAWVLMAVSYTISGWDKFQAPSWRDGSALIHLLENPLARDHALNSYLLTLPEIFFKLKTWGIRGLELFFAPMCIWKLTRKWAWVAMVFMHLGILSMVNFADLTIGMLMIHVFTFDPRWIKPRLKGDRILFFDGVCGLCNSSVDFFMQQDADQALKFAPLQGVEAKKRIPEFKDLPMDTLVLWENNKLYTRSSAVIKSGIAVGGVWGLARILLIIPTPVRNVVYNLISANRYKWFGKKESCRIPTPEEKGRILP